MTLLPLIFTRRMSLVAPYRSRGLSLAADTLAALAEESRIHLLSSISVRTPAERGLDSLENARARTALEGWDGYGALPMNAQAYNWAKVFIQALPTSAHVPEVSADPDGEVSIDWFCGQRGTVSVSIGPTGRLSWASLIGHNSVRGTEWIDDGISPEMLSQLAKLARQVDFARRPTSR
jgi:hypothetical protein